MLFKNGLKNISFSFIGQFVSLFCSFLTRTIFIKILGSQLLGLNGLYTNLISILSLAELGISTAITYELYEPIANNNHNRVSTLMSLYKRMYYIIACIVFVIGIIMYLNLDLFLDKSTIIPHYRLYFIFFLLNSVFSYFFTYKRTLVIAYEKYYVNTTNIVSFQIIQTLIQSITLFIFKDYAFYLAVQCISTLISNLSISNYVNKNFPFIKYQNVKLVKNVLNLNRIFRNITGMLFHKVGSVAISSISSIFISKYISLNIVGVYSNYLLIISMLNSFINHFFNSITASIGIFNAKNNSEESYNLFKKIYFINFWLISFSTLSFYILVNPFIRIWVGSNYEFDLIVVLILSINFYLYGMRQTMIMYINANGLFWKIRYKSLFEAGIFIILITYQILIIKNGIYGVVLSILLSTILTNYWWEPLVVYKNVFKVNFLDFFRTYLYYFLIFVFSSILCVFIQKNISVFTSNIIILFISTFFISNMLLILFMFILQNNEFNYFYFKILNFLKKF